MRLFLIARVPISLVRYGTIGNSFADRKGLDAVPDQCTFLIATFFLLCEFCGSERFWCGSGSMRRWLLPVPGTYFSCPVRHPPEQQFCGSERFWCVSRSMCLFEYWVFLLCGTVVSNSFVDRKVSMRIRIYLTFWLRPMSPFVMP